MIDQEHRDAVNTMLQAAQEVYETHEPGPEGNCKLAGCRAHRPTGPCLPFETADIVLTMWSRETYLAVKV